MSENRSRWPLLIAWGGTLAAAGAAAWLEIAEHLPFLDGHPARYDPALTVLTFTLIALIWYTYHTYEATQHERESTEVARQSLKQAQFHTLVEFRASQLERLRELNELIAVITTLFGPLGELLTADSSEELLRTARLWTEEDLVALRDRAISTHNEALPDVDLAVRHLRSALAAAQRVREEDPLSGRELARFRWDDWRADLSTATAALVAAHQNVQGAYEAAESDVKSLFPLGTFDAPSQLLRDSTESD